MKNSFSAAVFIPQTSIIAQIWRGADRAVTPTGAAGDTIADRPAVPAERAPAAVRSLLESVAPAAIL